MRAIPIEVNDLQFPSARAAARYIVAGELELDNERKENTVVKELKRCWQKNGGHSWMMYGRWAVKAGVIVGPGGREAAGGETATTEDQG